MPQLKPMVPPPGRGRVHQLFDDAPPDPLRNRLTRAEKIDLIFEAIAEGRDTVKAIHANLNFNMDTEEIRDICSYLVESERCRTECGQRGKARFLRYFPAKTVALAEASVAGR